MSARAYQLFVVIALAVIILLMLFRVDLNVH